MTADPTLIDTIVSSAWKRIHDGVAGYMEAAITTFFVDSGRIAAYMFESPEFQLKEIGDHMVYESLRKPTESAGSMDGWHPKELAYFSPKICEHVAAMYRQNEHGAHGQKRPGMQESSTLTSLGPHMVRL